MKKNLSKWKSALTQVPGTLHKLNNSVCQDITFKLFYKNRVIISLADGAGTAKLSHIGAEAVCKKICEIITYKFDDYYIKNIKYILEEINFLLNEELQKKMLEHNCKFEELSSTLLFVCVNKERYIAGHIGDGVIGYISQNGTTQVLSYPDNGEHLNETYFVSSSSFSEHFRFYRGELKDKNGFILLSDGAAESLYDKMNKKFAPAVNHIFSWLDKYDQKYTKKILIQNINNILSKKTNDDCSIAILKNVSINIKDILKLNNHSINFIKEFLIIKDSISIKILIYINDSINGRNISEITKEYSFLPSNCLLEKLKKLEKINYIKLVNGIYTIDDFIPEDTGNLSSIDLNF